MIEYLNGTFAGLSSGRLTLDVGGVGYCVYVPMTLLPPNLGEKLKLFTHQTFSENNGFTLFGFMIPEERALFEALISVSGVGPKTALAILSRLSIEELASAIEAGNSTLIAKAPGIGLKTAERLIIDLRGKIMSLNIERSSTPDSSYDAVRALESLGYSALQAQKAVKKALHENEEMPLGELITKALQSV